MSSPYQILIQTEQALNVVRTELERRLRPAQPSFSTPDAEEVQDAQSFFALRPVLSVDVAPARGGQDGALFVAVLTWAQSATAEVAVLLDYEQVWAFRDGTLQAPAADRAFFQREVLARWTGPVSWTQPQTTGAPA